ncbi:MAG TPA: alpha-mannosidase [Clostridiales bacterium]|nr:alpha-mannosidase [Clostridiales bacterium]
MYRWQAPSGKSVLVFREPLWYNWNIDGRCAMIVPDFCRSHGLTEMLRVYGVGDHGGGPTRRDIERIQDMDTWPIFPHYRFATYHDFYRSAEAIADRLPVVRGELNFIFDGCYTTQTRIKKGNRRAEAALFEAETLGALTHVALKWPYPAQTYSDAWKNVLFNQFHDILPGSGTVDTREYALGLYQQTFALANTQRAGCLRLLASQVDTSGLAVQEDIRLSRSEGAGVGYPTGSGNLAQVGRHAGLRRIFLVWNPLPFDRDECCPVTVWDWPGDPARMRLSDGQGQRLAHQLLQSGKKPYWGHIFQNLLVRIPVPALGYATLVLDEEPQTLTKMGEWDMRTLTPLALVLENEHLRAQISALDGSIVSLTDKATGQELARPGTPLLTFRLIEEDTERGMTAWTIGRYKKITDLNENVRIVGSGVKTGALRSSLNWQVSFGCQSSLEATLSLDAGSRQLNLDCTVRWQEIGSAATCIPQLNLLLQPAYACDSFRYDIPLGSIDRPALEHDVPALTYGLARNPSGRSLMLVSDSKYGFRGSDEGLALTLIRSSYDPDPWPEIGEHKIRLALALAGESDLEDSRIAQSLNHPLYALASQAHPGIMPLQASLVRLAAGQAHLEAVKISEDGQDLIVRLSSRAAEKDTVQLDFFLPPCSVSRTDLHEQKTDKIADQPWLDGRSVRLELAPGELATLRIGF